MIAASLLSLCKVAASASASPALLGRTAALQQLLSHDQAWLRTATRASSSSVSTEAAAAATASQLEGPSTSEATEPAFPPGAGWLWRTLKKPKVKDGWFPAKIGKDGKPIPPDPFLKFYWGVAMFGVALILGPRAYVWYRTPKPDAEAKAVEAAKAKEEKEAKQMSLLTAMMAGKSFMDDEDAFEGLSPKDINELASSKMGRKAVSDDPFEGMSPEEIDAYAELHGLS